MAESRQRILFILGCQRSGTTLAMRIFERDWNARVYGEFSELSSNDQAHGIRLNEFSEVNATLRKQRYAFLVIKPLVESQHSAELLQFFTRSSAIWMYRTFYDVAASDLAKFGERNGIDNIRPIVNREPNNWRSENVPASVRDFIAAKFDEDMNPMDAAALFWYARNEQYFSNRLHCAPLAERVLLMPYERLIGEPEKSMREVYRLAERPFPGRRLVSEVDPLSVGKGRQRTADISDAIRTACEALQERLDAAAGFSRTAR